MGNKIGEEGKHLEPLTGNQKGTEWQKHRHKTWDPIRCRQAGPPTYNSTTNQL